MTYKEQLHNAREFAIKKHHGQKYGIYPYEIHLGNVVSILLRFSVLPNNQTNTNLLASAWLHDILEDTNVSIEELENKFGKTIVKIVFSLTDGNGADRREKKENMYNKLVNNQDGIIVKLADRIANVEFCLIHNNTKLYEMYKIEQSQMEEKILPKINTKIAYSLLKYLQTLI